LSISLHERSEHAIMKHGDRRSRVRIPFPCKMDLRTELGIFRGVVLDNISMNGMFVQIQHPVPVDGRVTAVIDLEVPGSRLSIEIDGVVARRSSKGVGIKFDHDFKFWAILTMLSGFVKRPK